MSASSSPALASSPAPIPPTSLPLPLLLSFPLPLFLLLSLLLLLLLLSPKRLRLVELLLSQLLHNLALQFEVEVVQLHSLLGTTHNLLNGKAERR